MRSRFSIVLLLCAAGCQQLLGIEGLSGPKDAAGDGSGSTTDGPMLAECKAQRLVQLVGGNGGLSWFTLVWPAPLVITAFQPTFAYDDPLVAKNVTVDPIHTLYARLIGARAIWEGLGQDPHPTVFVAGNNETHTASPSSTSSSGGISLAPAAAAMQASLQPMYRAVVFPGPSFGTAPGAPAAVMVVDTEAAIGLFTAAVQQQVRPSGTQLARYYNPNANVAEIALGTQLAFTANAFRLGLITTVLMRAINDDPHGAFANGPGPAGVRANNLAIMLDAFYSDLKASIETTCGHNGLPMSLADNVVMVITGDTPKASFNNQGWGDGTVGNSNLLYLRSNGFTRPGWFGRIDTMARTNFDPNTGLLDPTVAAATSTAAAFASALYAIARGDLGKVTPFSTAPFAGVILR